MPKGVTSLNIKNENGSFTNVPIAVKAENVKLNNGKNLEDSVAYLDTETIDSGIEAPIKTPLYQEDVVDHLYSSSSITPLSAAQGKVLQNEIDTLKTAGTVPSDMLSSEIIDIRNGGNGKVYTSAGTAVRSQLSSKEDKNNKVTSKNPTTGELLVGGRNEKYPTINFLQQFYYDISQIDELIEQAKNQIGTADWAELKDLRVGADGEQYDNAGLAIRTNIKNVLNEIDKQLMIFGLTKTMLFDEDYNLVGTPSDATSFSGGGFSQLLSNGNIDKDRVKYAFISSKVTVLDSGTYSPCGKITDVYINNSKENIVLNDKAFPSNATIHYVDELTATDEIINIFPLLYIYRQILNIEADKTQITKLLESKADVKTTSQEIINTLPQFMSLATVTTTRAMYVDGQYLYHCGNSGYAVSKNDISVEVAPKQIKKIGGHSKVATRGIAAGNGYLYVPYRDNVPGTGTTHDSDDVGGYLDIIKLSDFSLAKTITYTREPYDPGDGKGVRYYGKSHNAAIYADKYLCVTQQLGGWLLYDIETTPENPTLLYKCDNRAQSTIDNTEFQQPAFYTDGTTVYLAIAGYDKDLLKIYDLTTPTAPVCVYSGDLRTLWQHGDITYLHAMGLVCKYPYIYCTVAPFPKYMTDFENTMQGVAVVDVSDINQVKVTFHKIPNESRTSNVGGEPSPQSVAVTKNHLVMDMFDKGVSVWSLANPAEPKFLGNLDTGATKVCSVLSTEDGRTFIGTEYQGGSLTMYRGL